MTKEQQMLHSISDFNEQVIKHWAASKNLGTDFNYKIIKLYFINIKFRNEKLLVN